MINEDEIIKTNLSYSEYIFLYLIYNKKLKKYYKNLDEIDLIRLQKKQYIKILTSFSDIHLRQKAIDLFKNENNYFKEFFLLYPIKTPSGRPLRTEKVETKLYNDLERLWNRTFKNKIEAEKKAIEALKEEIKYRKKMLNEEYYVKIRKWIEEGYYEQSFGGNNFIEENNKFEFLE